MHPVMMAKIVRTDQGEHGAAAACDERATQVPQARLGLAGGARTPAGPADAAAAATAVANPAAANLIVAAPSASRARSLTGVTCTT